VSKTRLEAFSDAVIAIALTIMVLELRPPHGSGFGALDHLVPKLLVYVLSFVMLAIYWNNHHHLFQVVGRVNGSVLWANMFLLFWLSLIPAATAWVGEHPTASAPVAVWGIVFFGAALAYFLLTRALLAVPGADSQLAEAIGRDWKGKLSAVAYAVAIPLALFLPVASLGIYVAVAIVWLVPDRRMERVTAD